MFRELAHDLIHELVSHEVTLRFMRLIAYYKINLTLFLYLVIVWRNMELEESCSKKQKVSKEQQMKPSNSEAQQMKPSNSKTYSVKYENNNSKMGR